MVVTAVAVPDIGEKKKKEQDALVRAEREQEERVAGQAEEAMKMEP